MPSEIQSLKLSIALTTYNHEEFIAKCLDSIIDQDLKVPYEIVIGEDRSTDSTRSIIQTYYEKYPELIRLLERNSNYGYTKNFNDTMIQCKGEYIAIFDGDDVMLPGKLNKQITFLDENPDFVMVGHYVDAFNTNDNKIIRSIKPHIDKKFYTIGDLAYWGSFFANSSKMFRKNAYPAGGIDPRIRHIADWAVTMGIAEKGKIAVLKETLALYRVHGTSIMQKLSARADFRDKNIIVDYWNSKRKDGNQLDFSRQWAYSYLFLGKSFLGKGKFKLARKCIKKSIGFDYKYSLSQYIYLFLAVICKRIKVD